MSQTPKQKNLIEYLSKGPEYEQEIFKKLDGIEWFEFLESQNYFAVDKNPRPVPANAEGFFTIPYWPALQFLERTAKECGEIKNLQASEKILAIIRNHTSAQPRVDNYHTWYSFLKIFNLLPLEAIRQSDVDLIRIWLKSGFDNSLVGGEIGKTFLPKLLASDRKEDRVKAISIIDAVTEIEPAEEAKADFEKWRLLVKPYWVRELFKRNATQIGRRCGEEALAIVERKLRAICENDQNNWSYLRRAAIEDHEQNLGEDTAYFVLVSAFRDILVAFSSGPKAADVLKRLLLDQKNIFRRLALYVTAVHYPMHGNIFWEVYDSQRHNLFHDLNMHHETHYFLSICFRFFSVAQKETVISYINSLETNRDDDPERKPKRDAYLRLTWLHALKDRGSDAVDRLYQEYLQLVGKEPEHPDFVNWHGEWKPRPSFDPAQFRKIVTADELVIYLNTFDVKNDFGETAYDELGEHLQARVKAEQNHFESLLMQLIPIKFVFHDYIIQAFKDLLIEGKPMNWEVLLTYYDRLIEEERLWSSDAETKDRYDRRAWVPTTIAQFLESGIRNQKIPNLEDRAPMIGAILKVILERQESSEIDREREDILTWAINTPRGRTFESFIVFVLNRCKEAVDEARPSIWEEYRPIFEAEIAQTHRRCNYEFFALAGRYLPNLWFMSKTWLQQNIAHIFPNNDPDKLLCWRAALDGYAYVSTVYAVIYDLLKRNGDLRKVIEEVHDHRRIRERCIDNIAVSYLRGAESLAQDSLFGMLLTIWNRQDIADVIGLMWSQRDVDFNETEIKRITDFWDYCHRKCINHEKENEEVLSDINLLAVFFKDLNDERKAWLLQSAPYVERRYHSTFLLEYLDRLADSSLVNAGEVFVKMLKFTIPTFHQENVISIVRKLYAGDQIGLADEICDAYDRAGHEFLRPIYTESRHKS